MGMTIYFLHWVSLFTKKNTTKFSCKSKFHSKWKGFNIDNGQCFFKSLFCISNVHHTFSKFNMMFMLIIKRATHVEMMKFWDVMNFSILGSNVLFNMNNLKFEIFPLTKVHHFCIIKGTDAWSHDIWSKCMIIFVLMVNTLHYMD